MDTDDQNIEQGNGSASEARRMNKREFVQSMMWLIIALVAVFVFARYVGFDNLEEKVDNFGVFGPILLAMLKASTLVFAPLGGAPLYPVAGALYGFWKGLAIIFIGDFIGASVAFYISRKFGTKIAEYFLSKPGMRAATQVITYLGTTKGIIQARIFFGGFPEAVHYAAGLTKISYTRYMLINVTIGLIPTIILIGLGDILVEHSSAGGLSVAGLAAIFVGFVGVWWISRQSRKNANIVLK